MRGWFRLQDEEPTSDGSTQNQPVSSGGPSTVKDSPFSSLAAEEHSPTRYSRSGAFGTKGGLSTDVPDPLKQSIDWENALRARAGDAVYAGSFIAAHVTALLYYDAPAWLFTAAYTAFAALVVATWWWVRPRRLSTLKTGERG